MDIKISDEQFQQLVSSTLMQAMSPESRDGLIAKAIADLLQRDTGNQYDKRSRLIRILDDAVQAVARNMVADWLENDETAKGKIRALYVEAFERSFTGEARETLVVKISNAVDKVLSGDRY